MVDFAGWDMPIHYGSQIEEHHAVRRHAGVFDVSHMAPVEFRGPDAEAFLRRVLANDVARIRRDGGALYTCMLDESGGVLDDLIVCRLDPERFLAVVNAATAARDLDWLRRQAGGFRAEVAAREDVALLAVQGPEAREIAARVLPGEAAEAARSLRPFAGAEAAGMFVSRTGYTGEDGVEVLCPASRAGELWDALLAAGAAPCGLGARDTLRLEAGLNLYGQDMDRDTTPLECGLGWTVAWEPAERDFIGRGALQAQREAGPPRRQVGLVLEGRGVMRHGQSVLSEAGDAGVVTSGSFAPTVGRSVALARVAADCREPLVVDIRGRREPVRVAGPPFVRQGGVCV